MLPHTKTVIEFVILRTISYSWYQFQLVLVPVGTIYNTKLETGFLYFFYVQDRRKIVLQVMKMIYNLNLSCSENAFKLFILDIFNLAYYN